VEILGRLMLALGVVLLIMWLLAKWARKPLTGKTDRLLSVLARQQLNRNASVAVIRVADRALIVGITDQAVRLLGEADLSAVEDTLTVADQPSRRKRGTRPKQVLPVAQVAEVGLDSAGQAVQLTLPDKPGALDGSILSPAVWRQLVNGARELTVRR
jgi:flagellar protein FliO/FliZ